MLKNYLARIDDGCVHCGCGCGGEGEYRTGNRVNAVATFRSSTL